MAFKGDSSMKLNNIESVEIYSTKTCPFCVKAKDFLEKNNIPYDEYIVNVDVKKEDIQARVDAMGLTNIEIRTVPQIFAAMGHDWVYIGGYTDLTKLT